MLILHYFKTKITKYQHAVREFSFRQMPHSAKAGFHQQIRNIFARSDFFPLSLSFRLKPSELRQKKKVTSRVKIR